MQNDVSFGSLVKLNHSFQYFKEATCFKQKEKKKSRRFYLTSQPAYFFSVKRIFSRFFLEKNFLFSDSFRRLRFSCPFVSLSLRILPLGATRAQMDFLRIFLSFSLDIFLTFLVPLFRKPYLNSTIFQSTRCLYLAVVESISNRFGFVTSPREVYTSATCIIQVADLGTEGRSMLKFSKKYNLYAFFLLHYRCIKNFQSGSEFFVVSKFRRQFLNFNTEWEVFAI